MKKIISIFVALVALVALASCSLQTITIQFEKLPEAVYEENDNANVEELLQNISVKVNGETLNLTDSRLTITGFDANTLSNPGTYTLIVVYQSASVAFSYTVIEKPVHHEVDSEEGLKAALADGGVIEIVDDFEMKNVIELKQSVSIYGNDHTITLNSGENSRLFNINEVSNINVNFYDVSLVNISKGASTRGVSVFDTKNINLTFENCNLSSGYYTVNLGSSNEGTTVTIKNSVISGGAALNIWSNTTTINVEESELISTWTSTQWRFGAIVFNGGARDVDNLGLVAGQTGQNNTLNIKDSSISIADKGANAYILVIQDACANNIINFDNCELDYAEGKLYAPDSYIPAANKFYVDGIRK